MPTISMIGESAILSPAQTTGQGTPTRPPTGSSMKVTEPATGCATATATSGPLGVGGNLEDSRPSSEGKDYATMENRDRDSLSLRWAGWPAALVILAAAISIEMLPLVGGTGEDAWFDWSWLYVTIHFILLPLVCLVHIVLNTYRFAALVHSQRSTAMQAALSMTIPVGYLLLLYFLPLPWATTLIFSELVREAGVEVGK